MRGYISGAAQRVFGDPSWWWRALILAAVVSVPYVGAFFVIGYYMILMREAAWGVERGLPRFGEYKEILRRAWDGFVVELVWGFALVVPITLILIVWVVVRAASGGLEAPPNAAAPLPWWVLLTTTLVAGVLAIFINVALLRTAVYLRRSAGLTIKGILGLIRRDPAGFRAVSALAFGVVLIAMLIGAPRVYLRYFVTLAPLASGAFTYGWGFLAAAVSAPLHLVAYTAYGLWAKDTDPSSWPPLQDPAPLQQPRVDESAPASAAVDSDDGPFSTGD